MSTTPEYPVSYEQFKMTVLKTRVPQFYRAGQQAFNMLQAVRPDLADQIRGDAFVDPFHLNDNLYQFWLWLEANWTNPEADAEEGAS